MISTAKKTSYNLTHHQVQSFIINPYVTARQTDFSSIVLSKIQKPASYVCSLGSFDVPRSLAPRKKYVNASEIYLELFKFG